MPQSLAKVYLHVVFSTKDRAPALADEWRDELFRVLGGAANNLGCQSLIVGFSRGSRPHVVSARADNHNCRRHGKIKSTSSAWINQTRGLSVEFHWQAGYAAFSVSQSNIAAVREYIRNQAEHHAKQSFQDELREWLLAVKAGLPGW